MVATNLLGRFVRYNGAEGTVAAVYFNGSCLMLAIEKRWGAIDTIPAREVELEAQTPVNTGPG